MKNFFNNYMLLAISLFLLFLSILLNVARIEITDTSLVISFIGAIAAFIVIGNVGQVMAIKQEFEEKNKALEEKSIELAKRAQTIDKQMEEVNIQIQFLEIQNKTMNKVFKELESKINQEDNGQK